MVKTDVLRVSRNTNQCLLQLNGAIQKQVYKFKNLGIAFSGDGRHDGVLDIRIGKAIAIKRPLHYLVVVRQELSKKSKALNFGNSLYPFSPTVSLYGRENSVMTKRVRSQVQASKMRFQKNQRSFVIDKVRIIS